MADHPPATAANGKAPPGPPPGGVAATTLRVEKGAGGRKQLHFKGAPLPAAAAAASPVLAEQLSSHSAGESCAVAVAPAAFEAWLEHLRPDYQSPAMEECSLEQDATRCQSLIAAESLGDSKYASAVLAELSAALTAPDADGAGSNSADWTPPTPTALQRSRARQIVATLPTPLLLIVLAGVSPIPDDSPVPDAATLQLRMPALAHLLLMLPPRFHPAVLCTRCPSVSFHRTLTLPRLPLHAPSAGGDTFDTASLTVHALAAAAVFAEGCPGAVWGDQPRAEGGKDGPPRHLQLSAAPLPGLSPLSQAAGPQEWQGSHNMTPSTDATLTSLHITLPRDKSTHWCAALLQLRTLRAVHLRVKSVDSLRAREFCGALGALPVLRQLHIRAEAQVPVDQKPVWDVFAATGGGTPLLEELAVENCFKCSAHPVPHMQTERALGHVSRLTALTRVSLRDNAINGYIANLLASALRAATGLREIAAGHACYGAHMVAAMCDHPGLPALRAVDLARGGATPFELLLPCVKPQNGAVLGRITALNLSHACINPRQSRELVALLRGMPALVSVNLAGNYLRDRGLRALGAVLPELQELQDIDVGNNQAGETGIFIGVIQGLCNMQNAGGAGPRRLGIAGFALRELSENGLLAMGMLLMQLECLEELDVRGLRLGLARTRDVMEDMLGCFGLLHSVKFSVGHRRELVNEDAGGPVDDVFAAEIAHMAAMSLRQVEVSTGDGVAFRRLEAAIARAAPAVRVTRGPAWCCEDEEPEPDFEELSAAMDAAAEGDLALMCEMEDMSLRAGLEEEELDDAFGGAEEEEEGGICGGLRVGGGMPMWGVF